MRCACELYAQYRIPSCIGFIDVSKIVLHQAPSVGRKKARTMNSYKEGYGYKMIAVVDQM